MNAVAARDRPEDRPLPARPSRRRHHLPAADLRLRPGLAGRRQGGRPGRARRAPGRGRPLPDRPLRHLHGRVVRAGGVAPGGVPRPAPQLNSMSEELPGRRSISTSLKLGPFRPTLKLSIQVGIIQHRGRLVATDSDRRLPPRACRRPVAVDLFAVQAHLLAPLNDVSALLQVRKASSTPSSPLRSREVCSIAFSRTSQVVAGVRSSRPSSGGAEFERLRYPHRDHLREQPVGPRLAQVDERSAPRTSTRCSRTSHVWLRELPSPGAPIPSPPVAHRSKHIKNGSRKPRSAGHGRSAGGRGSRPLPPRGPPPSPGLGRKLARFDRVFAWVSSIQLRERLVC